MTTHLFETENGRFILNEEYSKIGYCYPRIFVENAKTQEYTNIDVTIGACFKQSKSDFESWIDGTEMRGESYETICKSLGLNAEALKELIDEIQG